MDVMERRRELLAMQAELPVEYERVSGLHGYNWRDSWLVTDIKIGNNDYSVVADFKTNLSSTYKDFFLHGAEAPSNGYYYVSPYRDSTDGELYFYPGKIKTGIYVNLNTDYRLRYTVRAMDGQVTGDLNGDLFSFSVSNYNTSDTGFLLFAKSKVSNWHFTGEYYRHKMMIGDDKYDLIPCVRKTDSVVGFFDVIHRKFHSDGNHISAVY